jgi:carbamoyl-phosphate synthase large subunit
MRSWSKRPLLGWKEYELELLRDSNDNVVIICTVENLDPMGIHTGDSITVAPAMTLSDTAFQHMRNDAITMMRSLGNFAGGCNVQFALNPDETRISSPSRSTRGFRARPPWPVRPPATRSPKSPPNWPSVTTSMN